MKSRKGVVFAYGTLAVALIAGGSSFAYADKGGNKLNPNDIAAIHSIIPKIGNPGIGNGLSGANVPVPAAIVTGRPITPNSPTITLPAAPNSAAIGRRNSDSPALTPGAATLGSEHGKEGKDNVGKDQKDSVSITSRAADKASDKDKSKEGETAQSESARPKNAAASNEQEAVRIARLPSCT